MKLPNGNARTVTSVSRLCDAAQVPPRGLRPAYEVCLLSHPFYSCATGDPRRSETPPTRKARISKSVQRFRAAAVSLVTFLVMFSLGLIFLRHINKASFPLHIIAKSYLVRPIELRYAPSSGSSSVDTVAAGTNVNLTGYQTGDQGQHWLAVDWKDRVAYAPAENQLPLRLQIQTREQISSSFICLEWKQQTTSTKP